MTITLLDVCDRLVLDSPAQAGLARRRAIHPNDSAGRATWMH